MAYLVIARKWRPKTFSEVVGQQHVTITLENAIKTHRIASAYLFSGPRGVGKTTTARILAKALNCESGPTVTPCNSCTPCIEISEGRSMDVLEIDGASNRGIDEIRSLRESTRYTPSSLRYKIYIIDEVHMLTTEAFNALLKTLEEPPPHVKFIFATTEVNKVPATILSRCQRFDFRRIPVEKIVEQLRTICEAENIEVDREALYLIAKKSEGCMRDSQSLLDQVISFSGTRIKETDVINLLGMIDQDLYFEISRAIAEKNLAALAQIAQRIYEQGYDTGDIINGLIEHFHHLLILKTTGSTDHLIAVASQTDQYKQEADAFGETDLIRIIQLLTETAAGLKRSVNPHIQFETLLFRLAKLPNASELQQLLDDLQELKKKAGQPAIATERPGFKFIPEIAADRLTGSLFSKINGPSQDRHKDMDRESESVSAPGDYPQVDLREIQERWKDILAAVKRRKIHFASLLEEGRPARIQDNNKLDIVFDDGNGYHIHTLNENKKLIEGAIQEVIGKKVFVYCYHHSQISAAAETQEPQPPSYATQSETVAPVSPEPPVEEPEPAAAEPVSSRPVPEAAIQESDAPPAEPHLPARHDRGLETHPLAQKIIESLGGELIEP